MVLKRSELKASLGCRTRQHKEAATPGLGLCVLLVSYPTLAVREEQLWWVTTCRNLTWQLLKTKPLLAEELVFLSSKSVYSANEDVTSVQWMGPCWPTWPMKMQGHKIQGWLSTPAQSQGSLGSCEHIFMLLLTLPEELNLVKDITAYIPSCSVDEANGWYWSRNLKTQIRHLRKL